MTGSGLESAIAQGMLIAWHAARQGEASAVETRFGSRTFFELNANANRLVRCLEAAGLGPGDSVAVVSRNRPEFIEALTAGDRSGLRFTPINFHLTGAEIGYIVENCDAKAFIADASLGDAPVQALAGAHNTVVKLSVGGALDEFDRYEECIARYGGSDIAQPRLGGLMLYTSGTTGRPKGVHRSQNTPEEPLWEDGIWNFRPAEDRTLVTGPAYHAAPLYFDVRLSLASGVGVVMMDRWDAEESLRLIEKHAVTHCHMVATMFHRLLQLPAETRARYDLSSLRVIVHGAAPCPVPIKHAMIDWLGPILWEYYAATEGSGEFFIGSEEWLTKPGTVGKVGGERPSRVFDDKGEDVAISEVGTVYLPAPDEARFEYYKDSDKTAGSYRGDYFTLGDMGYLDEDGYLFLTGRTAELIISGGVNIYPMEVDAEFLQHPVVDDVCTVGVPDDEWGESVKSVIRLRDGVDGTEVLADELIRWVRERLASYKCPRSIDFSDDVPRSEAGKVQRKTVRARYWD